MTSADAGCPLAAATGATRINDTRNDTIAALINQKTSGLLVGPTCGTYCVIEINFTQRHKGRHKGTELKFFVT